MTDSGKLFLMDVDVRIPWVGEVPDIDGDFDAWEDAQTAVSNVFFEFWEKVAEIATSMGIEISWETSQTGTYSPEGVEI